MHAPGGVNPSGAGKGPFGETGFRVGLGLALAAILVGVAMLLFGDGVVADMGLATVVIASLALLTAGGLLLAERLLGRRPPKN
jgi:hypothetical protein